MGFARRTSTPLISPAALEHALQRLAFRILTASTVLVLGEMGHVRLPKRGEAASQCSVMYSMHVFCSLEGSSDEHESQRDCFQGANARRAGGNNLRLRFSLVDAACLA